MAAVHGLADGDEQVKRLALFLVVLWQYRRAHKLFYAMRIARDIAYRGLPF